MCTTVKVEIDVSDMDESQESAVFMTLLTSLEALKDAPIDKKIGFFSAVVLNLQHARDNPEY